MAINEDFDFRNELINAVINAGNEMVTIVLVSRQQYEIKSSDEAIVGTSVVWLLPRKGKHSFFPIDKISNIDIKNRESK